MNGYLIDTNVLPSSVEVSLRSPKSNSGSNRPIPDLFFASVVTWGELRKGVESKPAAQRRPGLEQWLERDLRDWFQSRLLPVTKTIADRWGLLAGQSKLRGKALTMADGIILATALEHDLVLVTRNVKDFAGRGASIYNP